MRRRDCLACDSAAGICLIDRRNRREIAGREDHRSTALTPSGIFPPNAWEPAARAIMTTDTFPKGATASAEIDGVAVRINGFAKGSGMIAPDMATMLGYIFTDATLPAAVLRPLLAEATDRSFNSITVDGDTSTSDTVLLCATQKAPHPPVTNPGDRRLETFRRALHRS